MQKESVEMLIGDEIGINSFMRQRSVDEKKDFTHLKRRITIYIPKGKQAKTHSEDFEVVVMKQLGKYQTPILLPE